jgi:hypothetical protein
MKYKKIITCGCGLSDSARQYTWVNLLEQHVKEINSEVSFDHRGVGGQGQQLIQKKVTHAIWKALSEGYKPEEICVLVMWSGVERRCWYITNEDTINTILNHWKKLQVRYDLQFSDLENKYDELAELGDANLPGVYVPYNKNGGWLITGGWHKETPFLEEYLMFCKGIEESIIISLENMIMLQSLCKIHNIKLYEQFYLDNVCEYIELYKDHKECKHLYELLDRSNYVNGSQSIHGYLTANDSIDSKFFKSKRNFYPNAHGHNVWFKDILLPHLESTGF